MIAYVISLNRFTGLDQAADDILIDAEFAEATEKLSLSQDSEVATLVRYLTGNKFESNADTLERKAANLMELDLL